MDRITMLLNADKAATRWNKIQEYLKTHDYIMNADVRALCGVSAATANRILMGQVATGNLVKCRENGRWAYRATGMTQNR